MKTFFKNSQTAANLMYNIACSLVNKLRVWTVLNLDNLVKARGSFRPHVYESWNGISARLHMHPENLCQPTSGHCFRDSCSWWPHPQNIWETGRTSGISFRWHPLALVALPLLQGTDVVICECEGRCSHSPSCSVKSGQGSEATTLTLTLMWR